MQDPEITKYLRRIGAPHPVARNATAVRELQRAHLLAIPFENLSIHLNEPIVLDPPQLFHKLVERRRGGFCYELNGAFADLLRSLGFDVTLLAARVFDTPATPGPPFDHLVLQVNLPEPWFVDVGFGDHSMEPLRIEPGKAQKDPRGTFEIVGTSESDLDVFRDGVPQYRVEMRPRDLTDFDAMCWYQQHSPDSHFTQSLVCSIATISGRATLTERKFITTTDDERTEVVLHDDATILATYREVFGIELDRVPTLSEHRTASLS